MNDVFVNLTPVARKTKAKMIQKDYIKLQVSEQCVYGSNSPFTVDIKLQYVLYSIMTWGFAETHHIIPL